MENIKLKRGGIEIIFIQFIIIFMLIFMFCIYMVYTQVLTYVIPPKQDLFYIVQNAYFSLNKEELEYGKYIAKESLLSQKVEEILKYNYDYCDLNYIEYDSKRNIVKVEIFVNIDPIILKGKIKNLKIKIKEDIKIKMMDVSVWETRKEML